MPSDPNWSRLLLFGRRLFLTFTFTSPWSSQCHYWKHLLRAIVGRGIIGQHNRRRIVNSEERMLWSKQKFRHNGQGLLAGQVGGWFLFGVEAEEMGLTTSFIEEQSIPMRYSVLFRGRTEKRRKKKERRGDSSDRYMRTDSDVGIFRRCANQKKRRRPPPPWTVDPNPIDRSTISDPFRLTDITSSIAVCDTHTREISAE